MSQEADEETVHVLDKKLPKSTSAYPGQAVKN